MDDHYYYTCCGGWYDGRLRPFPLQIGTFTFCLLNSYISHFKSHIFKFHISLPQISHFSLPKSHISNFQTYYMHMCMNFALSKWMVGVSACRGFVEFLQATALVVSSFGVVHKLT